MTAWHSHSPRGLSVSHGDRSGLLLPQVAVEWRYDGERFLQATCRKALEGLDDVQLALQLFSYPGDYITEEPTPERMAETIEKFEEDVFGVIRSIGQRCARVRFGTLVDLKQACKAGRTRAVIAKVTDELEATIGNLLVTPGP